MATLASAESAAAAGASALAEPGTPYVLIDGARLRANIPPVHLAPDGIGWTTDARRLHGATRVGIERENGRIESDLRDDESSGQQRRKQMGVCGRAGW